MLVAQETTEFLRIHSAGRHWNDLTTEGMSHRALPNPESVIGGQDALDEEKYTEAPPFSSSPDIASDFSPFITSLSRSSSRPTSEPRSPLAGGNHRGESYGSLKPVNVCFSNDEFAKQLDVLLLEVVNEREAQGNQGNFSSNLCQVLTKATTLESTTTTCASRDEANSSDYDSSPLGNLSPLSKLSNFADSRSSGKNITLPIDIGLPLQVSHERSGFISGYSSYRIIKRAESYKLELLARHHEPKSSSHKRQRNGSNLSSQYHSRNFAAETASLRRAASLRSDIDPEEPASPKSLPSFYSSHEKTPVSGAFCVPTVPATPCLSYGPPALPSRAMTVASGRRSLPVPIIAPPVDYVASLPQSAELLAKARISAFIDRDKSLRLRDGLFPDTLILKFVTPDSFLKSIAYSDGGARKIIDDGLSDSEYDDDDEGTEEEGNENNRPDIRYHDEGKGPNSLPYSDSWENILNIGKHEREQVVRWLLEVSRFPSLCLTAQLISWQVIPVYTSPSPLTSSSNSSFSSTILPEREPDILNLFDQLTTCPNTRFHAVWMFLRYFYLVMSETGNQHLRSADSQPVHGTDTEAGHTLVVWDIALGCLALSIKVRLCVMSFKSLTISS